MNRHIFFTKKKTMCTNKIKMNRVTFTKITASGARSTVLMIYNNNFIQKYLCEFRIKLYILHETKEKEHDFVLCWKLHKLIFPDRKLLSVFDEFAISYTIQYGIYNLTSILTDEVLFGEVCSWQGYSRIAASFQEENECMKIFYRKCDL